MSDTHSRFYESSKFRKWIFELCLFSEVRLHNIPLLLGTLSSPIEQGEMGAKRFTLQVVDGPLNCLYWEIVCHPLHYP